MEDLAQRCRREADAARYRELAERVAASFSKRFWNSAANCLYDVINVDERDASIRPDQIFPGSLFHRMLAPDQANCIVETVDHHLLTPFGLHTLSPTRVFGLMKVDVSGLFVDADANIVPLILTHDPGLMSCSQTRSYQRVLDVLQKYRNG
jgi:hypothetical protein